MTKQNLDQALNDYTVATPTQTRHTMAQMLGFGAAAAGGLLACGQVDADIVHTGPAAGLPMSIPVGDELYFDIDQDGDVDLDLIHVSNPGFGIRGLDEKFGGGTEARAGFLFSAMATSYNPTRLGSGDIISGGVGSFQGDNTGWMAWGSATSATDAWGIFSNAPADVTGFVGLEFLGQTSGGGEGTVYGWIKLQMTVTVDAGSPSGFAPDEFRVLDMAYQNDGSAINAGAVPEPASSGLVALTGLALGATGLRRRRKNKSA